MGRIIPFRIDNKSIIGMDIADAALASSQTAEVTFSDTLTELCLLRGSLNLCPTWDSSAGHVLNVEADNSAV